MRQAGLVVSHGTSLSWLQHLITTVRRRGQVTYAIPDNSIASTTSSANAYLIASRLNCSSLIAYLRFADFSKPIVTDTLNDPTPPGAADNPLFGDGDDQILFLALCFDD